MSVAPPAPRVTRQLQVAGISPGRGSSVYRKKKPRKEREFFVLRPRVCEPDLVPDFVTDSAVGQLCRIGCSKTYRFVGVILAMKLPNGLWDCLARSPYSAAIFCDSATNVS